MSTLANRIEKAKKDRLEAGQEVKKNTRLVERMTREYDYQKALVAHFTGISDELVNEIEENRAVTSTAEGAHDRKAATASWKLNDRLAKKHDKALDKIEKHETLLKQTGIELTKALNEKHRGDTAYLKADRSFKKLIGVRKAMKTVGRDVELITKVREQLSKARTERRKVELKERLESIKTRVQFAKAEIKREEALKVFAQRARERMAIMSHNASVFTRVSDQIKAEIAALPATSQKPYFVVWKAKSITLEVRIVGGETVTVTLKNIALVLGGTDNAEVLAKTQQVFGDLTRLAIMVARELELPSGKKVQILRVLKLVEPTIWTGRSRDPNVALVDVMEGRPMGLVYKISGLNMLDVSRFGTCGPDTVGSLWYNPSCGNRGKAFSEPFNPSVVIEKFGPTPTPEELWTYCDTKLPASKGYMVINGADGMVIARSHSDVWLKSAIELVVLFGNHYSLLKEVDPRSYQRVEHSAKTYNREYKLSLMKKTVEELWSAGKVTTSKVELKDIMTATQQIFVVPSVDKINKELFSMGIVVPTVDMKTKSKDVAVYSNIECSTLFFGNRGVLVTEYDIAEMPVARQVCEKLGIRFTGQPLCQLGVAVLNSDFAQKTQRLVPDDVKRKVLEHACFQCYICGSDEELEVHHKISLAKGGSNDISNLQVLCRTHNLMKGDSGSLWGRTSSYTPEHIFDFLRTIQVHHSCGVSAPYSQGLKPVPSGDLVEFDIKSCYPAGMRYAFEGGVPICGPNMSIEMSDYSGKIQPFDFAIVNFTNDLAQFHTGVSTMLLPAGDLAAHRANGWEFEVKNWIIMDNGEGVPGSEMVEAVDKLFDLGGKLLTVAAIGMIGQTKSSLPDSVVLGSAGEPSAWISQMEKRGMPVIPVSQAKGLMSYHVMKYKSLYNKHHLFISEAIKSWAHKVRSAGIRKLGFPYIFSQNVDSFVIAKSDVPANVEELFPEIGSDKPGTWKAIADVNRADYLPGGKARTVNCVGSLGYTEWKPTPIKLRSVEEVTSELVEEEGCFVYGPAGTGKSEVLLSVAKDIADKRRDKFKSQPSEMLEAVKKIANIDESGAELWTFFGVVVMAFTHAASRRINASTIDSLRLVLSGIAPVGGRLVIAVDEAMMLSPEYVEFILSFKSKASFLIVGDGSQLKTGFVTRDDRSRNTSVYTSGRPKEALLNLVHGNVCQLTKCYRADIAMFNLCSRFWACEMTESEMRAGLDRFIHTTSTEWAPGDIHLAYACSSIDRLNMEENTRQSVGKTSVQASFRSASSEIKGQLQANVYVGLPIVRRKTGNESGNESGNEFYNAQWADVTAIYENEIDIVVRDTGSSVKIKLDDLRDWSLGYASTVHKVQGRTIEGRVFLHDTEWIIKTIPDAQGVIYTSLTRPRTFDKLHVIVRQREYDEWARRFLRSMMRPKMVTLSEQLLKVESDEDLNRACIKQEQFNEFTQLKLKF